LNLIHGDSLQALKGYTDNHFDVAIVDPPYGLGFDGEKTSMTISPNMESERKKVLEGQKGKPIHKKGLG
jgi:DNA modification methylase